MDYLVNNGWIWMIFIGFIVGVLARLLKPGRDNMGIILTVVLGIAGAVFATWGGQLMGWYQPGQSAGFFGALAGAIVLLVIVGIIRGATRKR